MKLHKNFKIQLSDKSLVFADIEEYTRGGTYSPTLFLIHYNGKRYTPYEQKRLGMGFPLNTLFKMVYSDKIADLIPDSNPFFKRIDKTAALYTTPVVIPFKV